MAAALNVGYWTDAVSDRTELCHRDSGTSKQKHKSLETASIDSICSTVSDPGLLFRHGGVAGFSNFTVTCQSIDYFSAPGCDADLQTVMTSSVGSCGYSPR